MPFQLLIDGLPSLPLDEVRLTRELGGGTQWHFRVFLKSANLTTAQERNLFELFRSEDAVKAKALWAGTLICPSAKIVGFSQDGCERSEWHGSPDHLDISAGSTAATGVGISPFLPRRRVHKADNVLELLQAFRNVGNVTIERLGQALEKIEFRDNQGKACIIQDGLSDWDFLAYIMDQCRILEPTGDWLPLTLTGSVSEGNTSGKWIIVPGKASAYVQWKEIEPRRIRFTADDGEERFYFGEIGGGASVPDYQTGSYPSLGIVRPWRKFDASRWNKWRTRDLPLFCGNDGKEMMVWRVRDRLFEAKHDELVWETFVDCAPGGAEFRYRSQPYEFQPWTGCGTVTEATKKGQWIKVQLSGFEKGWDTADVRLSTPFAGKKGSRGLHLVPEVETEVEVCWPGRFDTSVVLIGNTRWHEAEFESPSLYLEDTYHTHYANVKIAKIGDVSVGSNLSVAVDATTAIKSQSELSVKADGADLRMSNGIVYTG